MKKLVTILFSVMVLFTFTFGMYSKVDAAPKTFKNCTTLNKSYKGGIAKSTKVKNKGGKTKYKPFTSSSLYNANKKLDRDKDGIVCER